MIIEIDAVDDPRLDPFRWRERQLASRADRLEAVGSGMFVAEGDLVVERSLAAGREPVALLCARRHAPAMAARVGDTVPVYVGGDTLRREVTGLGVPLGITGLFRRPALLDVDVLVASSRRIVVMEAVDNPTNLGAVVRSAAALGWDALVLDATSADPLARRALRVSMGTGVTLPFARLGSHDSVAALLGRHRCTSVALTPAPDAAPIPDVHTDGRVALLLGSERDGLSAATMAAATVRARIPMHAGVDSLNVGAAAAIALHELGPDAR